VKWRRGEYCWLAAVAAVVLVRITPSMLVLEAGARVSVIAPLAATVVKAPVEVVVAPIDILLIVPAVAGLSVTTPVPVGLITTLALAGDSVTAPSAVSAGVIVTRPVLTLPMPIVPVPLALIVRLVFD